MAVSGPYSPTQGAVSSNLEGPVKRKNGKPNGQSSQESNGYRKNGFVSHTKEHHVQNGELPKTRRKSNESFEEPSLVTAFMTNFGLYILLILGYINSIFFTPKVAKEKHREGYATLYDPFEMLFMRYIYRRLRDCYNQPICSVPGSEVVLVDRTTPDFAWTFEYPGTKTKCLNLGSYNYLGFAESSGVCAESAREAITQYGSSLCSTVLELGTTPLHEELERTTAQFLGVEDAVVFGMGFATNSLNIPSLITPETLVLSDEKNHASLILGLRLSGATVKVYKHNNMKALESVLRRCLVDQTKKFSWKKIVIVAEGVFSMEGSIIHLPELIAVKKKYKAYLYLDEAHSVGALGPRGRGVIDYHGCDPHDIDILMGTFTKSFGSAGGYIAGSKRLVDHVRAHSHATHYACSMSPPVAAQILSSMRVIMQPEGQRRVRQLARNTRYFRDRLKQMGVIIYGNDDSPVVPVLVYLFSKIGAVVRTLKARGIAAVGVGFPATPLSEGRIRFCLSAAHTKEQLDYALTVMDEIADELGLRYSRRPRPTEPVVYGADDNMDD